MMRECEDHGYFREEECPICGNEGKFLMNDFEVDRLGRTVAAILRHGKFDLPMDEQGFVSIRKMVGAIKDNSRRMHWLRPHHIIALAETDPKGRYQISGDMVRAMYGHTIPLNLNLSTDNIPDELYYPTTPEEAEIILEVGLRPSDRSMVHLSLTYQDAYNAGSVRVESPLILAIDVDKCFDYGYDIGKAGKTVFLCKAVPADCLRIIHEEEINE
ncbi:MAG: RNA 2'-phosphotransferase [Thermoplasmata archaeon]|nr:RNA 2'-phosphotransferase [Thermoplasmata archaeon]